MEMNYDVDGTASSLGEAASIQSHHHPCIGETGVDNFKPLHILIL